MFRAHLFLLSGAAIFGGANILSADPIKFDTGMISGIPGNSPEVRIYNGIPYAAPPQTKIRAAKLCPNRSHLRIRRILE